MKRLLMGLAILVLALVPLACGDSGGGTSGTADLTGVSFTAQNAATLAGGLAAIVDPFARTSVAAMRVIGAAEAASGGPVPPPGVPRGLVDLGDLGLCDSGQSPATWDDADDSNALSAGDVLAVTLTDCDGVTAASVSFTLDAADLDGRQFGGAVEISATIVEPTKSPAATTVITGGYQLQVDMQNQVCVHQVSANADAAQKLRVVTGGVTILELGCFILYFDFDAQGGFILSEPIAVFKIPTAGIMSVESYGLPALSFPDGRNPAAGQVDFVAMSVFTPCTAVGVPGDGISGNASNLHLTATAGGHVTLEGETAGGAPFTVESNWQDLY